MVLAAAAALLPARVAAASETAETQPNQLLLATGIATAGFTYAASAYVGLTSPHASSHWLVLPLAGPWVSLGTRGTCGRSSASTCEVESAYKTLLVVDGIVQLAGAAQILAAFFQREPKRSSITIAPVHVPGGAALVGTARF